MITKIGWNSYSVKYFCEAMSEDGCFDRIKPADMFYNVSSLWPKLDSHSSAKPVPIRVIMPVLPELFLQ